MTTLSRRFGAVFGLTAVGYGLSFCSQILISRYFGTSSDLDTYWTGIALVNLLCFYVNPLKESVISAIHRESMQRSENSGEVVSAVLAFMCVLLSVSSAVLMLFSDEFTRFMVGSDNRASETLLQLLPWLLPYIWLFAIAETVNTVLVSFNRLIFQAVTRLFASLALIGGVALLGSRIGVPALAIAQSLGCTVMLVACMFALRRLRLRVVWNAVGVLRRASVFPVFASFLASYFLAQLYVMGERAAMIRFSSGLVSGFQYSTTLVNVLVSLTAYPLANLLWPRFMEQSVCGDREAARDGAAKTVGLAFAFLLFAGGYTWNFAEDIIRLLFHRGAFDERSVQMTAKILQATVFAAVPMGTGMVFGRFLMSFGLSRWIAWSGLATTLAGSATIAVALVFESERIIVWHWCVANMAGGVVAAIGFCRGANLSLSQVRRVALWMIATAGAAIVAGVLTPNVVFGSDTLGLAASLVVEGFVYVALCAVSVYLLRVHVPFMPLMRGQS